MNEHLKPKLRVIPVRWLASPSFSDIHLSCNEDGGAEVEFNADFGSHSEITEGRVKLAFSGLIRCCLLPAASDDTVIPSDAFSDDLISGRRKKGETIEAFIDRFRNEWRTSGVCPDPGFYFVEDSHILKKYPRGFEHFLLLGSDHFIEIVAQRWHELKG